MAIVDMPPRSLSDVRKKFSIMDPLTPSPPVEPGFRPTGRIVRAAEADAVREGSAWLNDARQRAERLLADARMQAEVEIAAARQRGYEDGRRTGEKEAARLLADAAATADAYLESIREDVAALVVEAVTLILGSYDSTDVAAQAVRHALQRVRRQGEVTVFVAPCESEAIARRLATVLTDADARQPVSVEPDPHLAPGRCVLASAGGFIDAGIAEQIDALRAALGAPVDRTAEP